MECKIERLRSMMGPYEGPQHTVVGVSIHDGNPKFMSSGVMLTEAPYDELIFEIGSITKVFTSILLCTLIDEGKVDPRAPLREMSDELGHVPDWITPESLASHTSGLPNIHVPIWKALINPTPEGPHAKLTLTDLLAWLHNWRGKAPGPKLRHAYSNLGFGLLGESMALMEGRPFVDLLAEKVIVPLGLKDTTDRLDQDQRSRFAQPKNTKGKAVSPWMFSAMAGAGCLRSSARDLARFSDRVIQALNTPETMLDRAICRAALPIFGLAPGGGMKPSAQSSGWLATKFGKADPRFLHASGGTGGSTCAIYICPEKEAALAVLSNNGIAANLWASACLSWSNQLRQVNDHFKAT